MELVDDRLLVTGGAGFIRSHLTERSFGFQNCPQELHHADVLEPGIGHRFDVGLPSLPRPVFGK